MLQFLRSIAVTAGILLILKAHPAFAETASEVALINNQGVKALSAGNFDLALEKFTQALKLDPNYRISKDNLAILYNNKGIKLADEPTKAIQMFWKAVYLDSSNPTSVQNLNITIEKMGKDPKSFDHRISLGDGARKSGELEGAMVEYQAALKLKDDGPTHEKLGDCCRVKDRVDEAIEEYRLALNAKDSALVRVKLGQALQTKDALAESISEFKQALALEPNERETLESLRSGWEAALNKNPTAPENHIGLGQAYQLLGDFSQAKAEYESAKLWSPGRKNSVAQKLLEELPVSKKKFESLRHVNMGVEYQSRKMLDHAIKEYEQAQKLIPQDPNILANIGTAWQGKGDLVRAQEFYNKALALQPNNPVALSGIKSCKQLEEKKTKIILEKPAAGTARANSVEDVYAKVYKVEVQILKQPYSSDDVLTRLERLDLKAFGHVQPGSVSERIERLQKKTQPASAASSSADEKLGQVQKALAQLETKAFSKTFESDDVLTRLSRLEQKQLGKEQSGTLMKRIDALLILQ